LAAADSDPASTVASRARNWFQSGNMIASLCAKA
jgi:hypothetical protein